MIYLSDLSGKPGFKGNFVFILIFACLLIFQYSYGNSSGELPLIDRILEQYDKERSKVESSQESIKLLLEKGKELSSIYYFAVAGQSLLIIGNIKEGIKVLKEAVSIDPTINGPHLFLAKAYYQLAIYNMFKKGLYKINVISREDIPWQDYRDGYLGVDIKELAASEGRPASYGKALSSKGFDKIERLKVILYWLFLIKDEISPDARKVCEQTIMDLGLPDALPVPTFWPDKETIEILKLAKKEMMIGEKGKEMQTPPGVMVIRKKKFRSLSKRINQLLQEQEKSDVNSSACFSADLNVYCGNSGSPVFDRKTHEVIGIVVRGDTQDFRWTGKGWLSVIYPNPDIRSQEPQCTRVLEFRDIVAGAGDRCRWRRPLGK